MAEQQQQRQQRQSNTTNRAQLVKDAARNNVPEEVDYIDGRIITDLLSTIGWIDYDLPEGIIFDFQHFTKYKLDKKGRITQLALGQGPYTTKDQNGTTEWIRPTPEFSNISWILPKLISRLTKLQELILWKCSSLPENFDLPKLRLLVLQNCDSAQIFKNIMNEQSKSKSNSIKLPVLDKLILREFSITSSTTNAIYVINFLKQLPSLARIEYIDDVKQADENRICCDRSRRSCTLFLQLLLSKECCSAIRNKLVNIGIYNFKMTSDNVKLIFNKLLTTEYYPNITGIALQNNGIETFQGVVSENFIVNRKLVKLLIDGNPVTDKLLDNVKNEQDALLSILSNYNRVSCIGSEVVSNGGSSSGSVIGRWQSIQLNRYGPNIEYALRINYAGRTLIENVPLLRHRPVLPSFLPSAAMIVTTTTSTDADGTISSIPLYLWPIVLERSANNAATQKPKVGSSSLRSRRNTGLVLNDSNKNQHTGLNYLIRNNIPFFENLI
jgi:hypothetical protein